MTSRTRGMPRRPRASRTDGLYTPDLLSAWARTVRQVETGIDEGSTGCPLCDGTDGLDARDQLERLIVRGGRRGRRVAAAVESLDARYERATTPVPLAPRGSGWWRHRYLD